MKPNRVEADPFSVALQPHQLKAVGSIYQLARLVNGFNSWTAKLRASFLRDLRGVDKSAPFYFISRDYLHGRDDRTKTYFNFTYFRATRFTHASVRQIEQKLRDLRLSDYLKDVAPEPDIVELRSLQFALDDVRMHGSAWKQQDPVKLHHSLLTLYSHVPTTGAIPGTLYRHHLRKGAIAYLVRTVKPSGAQAFPDLEIEDCENLGILEPGHAASKGEVEVIAQEPYCPHPETHRELLEFLDLLFRDPERALDPHKGVDAARLNACMLWIPVYDELGKEGLFGEFLGWLFQFLVVPGDVGDTKRRRTKIPSRALIQYLASCVEYIPFFAEELHHLRLTDFLGRDFPRHDPSTGRELNEEDHLARYILRSEPWSDLAVVDSPWDDLWLLDRNSRRVFINLNPSAIDDPRRWALDWEQHQTRSISLGCQSPDVVLPSDAIGEAEYLSRLGQRIREAYRQICLQEHARKNRARLELHDQSLRVSHAEQKRLQIENENERALAHTAKSLHGRVSVLISMYQQNPLAHARGGTDPLGLLHQAALTMRFLSFMDSWRQEMIGTPESLKLHQRDSSTNSEDGENFCLRIEPDRGSRNRELRLQVDEFLAAMCLQVLSIFEDCVPSLARPVHDPLHRRLDKFVQSFVAIMRSNRTDSVLSQPELDGLLTPDCGPSPSALLRELVESINQVPDVPKLTVKIQGCDTSSIGVHASYRSIHALLMVFYEIFLDAHQHAYEFGESRSIAVEVVPGKKRILIVTGRKPDCEPTWKTVNEYLGQSKRYGLRSIEHLLRGGRVGFRVAKEDSRYFMCQLSFDSVGDDN